MIFKKSRTSYFLILKILLIALMAPSAHAQNQPELSDYVIQEFGAPPAIPNGALASNIEQALDKLVAHNLDQTTWQSNSSDLIDVLVKAKDPRVAWIIVDMMRFTWRPDLREALSSLAVQLLDIDLDGFNHRIEFTNYLLAWDMPAYPGYLKHKRAIFTNFNEGWDKIFVEGDIDWQMVAWGGVDIDARAYDTTVEPCNCIPAADNPAVDKAKDATWLKDQDVVFGVGVNGEYRAYPRRIMEIREMVNDTLGGRDLGIPYCTLCGAMQAYFTDELPDGVERPVLRTSGLLIRSNKVMYDVRTNSVFDTFKGNAVTGPLYEIGLQLKQATVVTTTWGEWKAAHPETTVLVEELALGGDFDLRNTRDKDGPIFPVGDVDPRLPVHEDIIGVFTESGVPVAFPRTQALVALKNKQEIKVENVTLELDGGGVRAVDIDGSDLGSHQAFWFAWSQFHPTTLLWGE